MNRRSFLQSVIAVPLVAPWSEPRITLGVTVPAPYRVHDRPKFHALAFSLTMAPLTLVAEAQRIVNRINSDDAERRLTFQR